MERSLTYRQFLALYYRFYLDSALPAVPDPITRRVTAFVNADGWIWKCEGC